ncbi:hypothetical protein SDJN02_14808, partial [Cucurbita argyrosperma subsp. argyrosperma]
MEEAFMEYCRKVEVHQLFSEELNLVDGICNNFHPPVCGLITNFAVNFRVIPVPVRIDATFHEQAAKIASNLGKSATYPLPQDLSLR